MYYREEVIEGLLCYKSSPDGEWKQVSEAELQSRLNSAKLQVATLESCLANLRRA